LTAAAPPGAAVVDRFFCGAWATAFFLLVFTRSVATPPFLALTVLAAVGTAYCAFFMRGPWRRIQQEHAVLLASAVAMALVVVLSQVAAASRGGPAGFVPAHAPLLVCLPVLALLLTRAGVLQAAVALFCAVSLWHFFMMPVEAATGYKWTWHPVELLPREAGPFRYQASGLALQAFTFVGLFLPIFYLAWGPVHERRAFRGWGLPPRWMAAVPLLWLIPVASVQSRSALAGALVAGGLAYVSSRRRLNSAAWVFLGGCAVLTLVYYLYMSQGKTGAGLRLAYMELYVREALDWRWLPLGRGYPGWTDAPRGVPGLIELTHSHNDLVQVFHSWGLPGLLAYLAFWAALLRLVWTRFVALGEYWPALALVAVVPNFITDVGFHFFEKAAFLVILAAMCIACARVGPAPAAGSDHAAGSGRGRPASSMAT
jgi:hypothetical protein